MEEIASTEHGVITKSCRRCLRVALLYPSVYEAAVASLAFQMLYYLINSLDYVVAERFVCKHVEGYEPEPKSLESKAPLKSFDVIIVSLSYELDYVNLARVLNAAGIPLLRKHRIEGRYPLIVLGGPAACTNPELSLEIGDVVLVGEIEAVVPKLLDAIYTERLNTICCRDGILCPDCSHPVRKAYVSSLDTSFHPVLEFRVKGSGHPWGEAFMVEVSRGCPYSCFFCLETRFLSPLRHRSYNTIVRLIDEGVEVNGVDKVALYALSFFSHPHADKILDHIIAQGLRASVGSIRADTLNEDRIDLLKSAGQELVTLAPETFSEASCRRIGKCISYDTIEQLADYAWSKGMSVKLYLMTGLPEEDEEEFTKTIKLVEKLALKAPNVRRSLRISINPLIPKPFTPLEGEELIDRRSYKRRVKAFERLTSRRVEVAYLPYSQAIGQVVINRSGAKALNLVIEWAKLGGAYAQVYQAAKRALINLDEYRRRGHTPSWKKYIKLQ